MEEYILKRASKSRSDFNWGKRRKIAFRFAGRQQIEALQAALYGVCLLSGAFVYHHLLMCFSKLAPTQGHILSVLRHLTAALKKQS